MFKIDLIKEEVEKLKSKIYLSELQEQILEYRLRDYSTTQISMLVHCSERTVYRQLQKIREKIKKVF